MAGVDNLTPWHPGTSGNPKGRPAGSRSFKTILRELLDKPIDVEDKDTGKKVKSTARDEISMILIFKAMSGHLDSIKEVRDIVDGPIKQKLEVEDKTPEKPLSERANDIAERLIKLGADAKNKKPRKASK